MVSGSLALLYFLLGFHGGWQGSGPDRGQCPIEWGDFLSVSPFGIHRSVCPKAWLDGPEGGNGWTNKRKISPFYRTLSPIGAAAQKAQHIEKCNI